MSARAPGVLLIEKSEMWVMAHDICKNRNTFAKGKNNFVTVLHTLFQ